MEKLNFKKSDKDRTFILNDRVIIKAGTKLTRAAEEHGGDKYVEACIEIGEDSHAWFSLFIGSIKDAPEDLITEIDEKKPKKIRPP